MTRVLRGNEGSCALAIKWFQNFFAKAIENNIDELVVELTRKFDASGKQFMHYNMLPYHDEILPYVRCVMTAQTPASNGNVVQYFPFVDFDQEGILANVEWNHWVRFQLGQTILRAIELDRLSQVQQRMVKMNLILDVANTSMGFSGLPWNQAFKEKHDKDVVPVMESIAAEHVGKVIILNVPWSVIQTYNIFSPFLPAIQKKFQLIYGDGYNDTEVLDSVGGDTQLRALIGGRVGLIAGCKDEDEGEKTILTRSTFEKSREVRPGQVISWKFEVLGGWDTLLGSSEVEFSACAFWALELKMGDAVPDASEQIQEIQIPRTYTPGDGEVTGRFRCFKTGFVRLVWTNPDTMMRNKSIRFEVKVADAAPLEADDVAALQARAAAAAKGSPAVASTHGSAVASGARADDDDEFEDAEESDGASSADSGSSKSGSSSSSA